MGAAAAELPGEIEVTNLQWQVQGARDVRDARFSIGNDNLVYSSIPPEFACVTPNGKVDALAYDLRSGSYSVQLPCNRSENETGTVTISSRSSRSGSKITFDGKATVKVKNESGVEITETYTQKTSFSHDGDACKIISYTDTHVRQVGKDKGQNRTTSTAGTRCRVIAKGT
jgi:hypothetical protein